jgi:hypothetical protein
VSVSPNQATQGAGGLSFTFTYTAVNAWSNGTLTLDIPGGWTLPNNAAGQPGAIIASTGSGNIGSLNASGSTITLGGVNLSAGGTLTVTYGWLGSSGPGVTAPNSAGFYSFIVRSDPTGSAVANLGANPQVELKAPTATLTPTVGSDGPNEIEHHSAFPSPWDGGSPLYVACKLSGHVDRLVLKVYTRSLVCVGSTELGAQNAGWTKIAAPTDFMLSAANGGYFYIVTAERDGQKNITKAIGKLLILR